MELIARVEEIVLEVQAELAPDPRDEIFDVQLREDDGVLSVCGTTSSPAAAEALRRRVGTLDAGLAVRLDLRSLPLPEARAPHAICTSALAPMLSGPLVSETPISQTVLGHRLLVYREYRHWLHCRSDDGYIGWIHRGYLKPVTELEARRWEAGGDGVTCISLGGRARGEDGSTLAWLPWGARVIRVAEDRICLPDGREARPKGDFYVEADRARRFPLRGSAVTETALRWVGAPYTWGGVTRTGVDCSGFVQALYRTHGLALPRDSDQQARVGQRVDPGEDFAGVLPGDLLFFAEEGARVSHVALSLGGSRIVHASLGNGGVATNDLLGDTGFERELCRLLVRVRRVGADV